MIDFVIFNSIYAKIQIVHIKAPEHILHRKYTQATLNHSYLAVRPVKDQTRASTSSVHLRTGKQSNRYKNHSYLVVRPVKHRTKASTGLVHLKTGKQSNRYKISELVVFPRNRYKIGHWTVKNLATSNCAWDFNVERGSGREGAELWSAGLESKFSTTKPRLLLCSCIILYSI